MRTERLGETLLPKKIALPVFCSDPLSSNAYATEEILRGLSLAGMGLLYLTGWVALAVVVLLVVVVASYRQTCDAYPTGGGAYAVSRANLGRSASLAAASALLIDYVLTVAVSVAAGVDATVSAFPALSPYAVGMCLAGVAVLAVMNLRGVKESGTVFAVPTYGFIVMIFAMLGWGAVRIVGGHTPVAESASFEVLPVSQATGVAAVLLALRAFSQGCTSLTGTEAVSNGVPSFRPPKGRNAAATLTIMGAITIVMFVGITALAIISKVRVADDPAHLAGAPEGYQQRTVVAQVAGAVFGHGVLFVLVLAFTAAILVLAANTAFNGFPILASILSADGFLPRQFARRGDRLAFSNGIIILALLAGGLIWAFDASTTRLIQLYIIGVFVSFTLSQAGMVRHWNRRLATERDPAQRRRMHRSRFINGFGAAFTALVLVVVLVSKFTHGAWIVAIAMPALFILMLAIRRHYDAVARELEPERRGMTLPARIHAVVLVSRLHKPTLRALAYARATRPDTLTALTVATNPDELRALQQAWAEHDVPVALTVLGSPYRDITGPVLQYVAELRRRHGANDLVVVYLPEYVVGRWWEHLLHNQSALRLKSRLLFQRGVMTTNVPWQLASSLPHEQQTPATEPGAVPATPRSQAGT